jgi:threonine synthase
LRYVSTRGEAPELSFEEALLAGLARDGGLYVPKSWPQIAPETIADFAGKPFADVAVALLEPFAGGAIPRAELIALARDAYARFGHPAVTPLVQIDRSLWVLELFHGPTLAFKDVAMQLLARLMDRVLAARGERVTIVAATSGDTGGAAFDAFRGSSRVEAIVLFPQGRISDVQRRMMTTAAEPNVHAVAVEGTFDDCQALVKAMFNDLPFRDRMRLAAVNSINWGRVVAQVSYYFVAAAALGSPTRPMLFSVPTGNFGDAFAGYVAHRMGLPLARILVATNANDILDRAFRTGRYVRGQVVPTLSPAMDIQAASNFERLFFEATGRDAAATAAAFEGFAANGELTIPPAALSALQGMFASATIDDGEVLATIASTHAQTGQVIDPHTAVAVAALRRNPETPGPVVVLSTAHPAKFPEDVARATGAAPPLPLGVDDLGGRPERFERLPAEPDTIKGYVRAFAEA